MKKLIILGAVVFASMTFAKTSTEDIKNPVKTETVSQVKATAQEKSNSARPGQLWTVTIGTPCGPVNVTFSTSYADGSAGFIDDLAYSVNYAYNNCGPH